MSESYEDTLSIEDLRKEVRRLWDIQGQFLMALRELPEVPNPRVLKWLDRASTFPRDHNAGKEMQRRLGLEAIPPVCECEGGAGIWKRIRDGLAANGDK